jgi:hypothetical protein
MEKKRLARWSRKLLKKIPIKSPHFEEKINGFTNIFWEKLSRFLAF